MLMTMIRLSFILVLVLGATPAFAQSFLNGDWVGLFHEDEPNRAPGPDPYTGLPANAAGRQYADCWDASRCPSTSAGLTCRPISCVVRYESGSPRNAIRRRRT